VRFFVDECISPSLSRHLNATGLRDAIHARDRGRLRSSDRAVFELALREDRIIVTENAADFRKLAAIVEVHPGLLILPSVARLEAQRLMDIVVAYLFGLGGDRPQDLLVNTVLTISASGTISVEATQ
jgi:predicted nuclease of predicted toxin-antitoxin system